MQNNTLLKLHATADILGGEIFFTDNNGNDPDNIDSNGNIVPTNLVPNCLYIRLKGDDGSIAYISGYDLNDKIKSIESSVKTNKSDIETIQSELDNKATKQDISNIEASIESLPNLSNIEAKLEAKANKTDLYKLEDKINNNKIDDVIAVTNRKLESKADISKIAEIETILADNQPNIDKIDNILTDISNIQNVINTLTGIDTGSIQSLQAQINAIKASISKLISIDVLTDLKNNLESFVIHRDEDLSARLDVVEMNLNNKASSVYVQNKVTDLNNKISDLLSIVDNKANKYDVSLKANKSDVETLSKRFISLNTKVSDIETNTDNLNQLVPEIENKADKSFVEDNLVAIKNELREIPSKAAFDATNSSINYKISTLENKHDNDVLNITNNINTKYCELENNIDNIQSTLNSINRLINANSADIDSLQDKIQDNTDKLKYPWVRVLSTNEYKRLRLVPDGVNYYSPYYIYPNIIYFVVDFNRPKAVYIGNIQIAKAELTGSVGFAYTFPISF